MVWLGNGFCNVFDEVVVVIELEFGNDEMMEFYSDVFRLFEVVFEVERSVVSLVGVWLIENFIKVVIVVFMVLSVLIFVVMCSYEG